MPGALPARRMRRLAPRPSVVRGNAVNSNCMVRLPMSAAFRVSPREKRVDGRPRLATSGKAKPRAPRGPLPGKALNYNRNRRVAATSRLFSKKRAHRFFVRHAGHRLGKKLRARQLADARTRPRFVGE